MKYPESQCWKSESMELVFWWIICWEVDAFADVNHQLNKHDYRQQNGPGGVVSAPWSLTSPICTKFLQALWSCCFVHAMICLSAARWQLVAVWVSRNSPGTAALGTVLSCILLCGGKLLLASAGFGARPLFSYLQYSEKRTPTWTAVCMDYQSTTLTVLSNFHSFLLHNVLS